MFYKNLMLICSKNVKVRLFEKKITIIIQNIRQDTKNK